MTTTRSRVVLLAFLAVPTSIATFAACVGDVANVPTGDPDAAARTDGTTLGDGTTDDAPGADGRAGDAGIQDTGTTMDADDGAPCNLSAPFGRPENVTELNSTADDTWPRISADGKTLYFSRNVAGGNFYDTMDVWRASRGVASGPFGAPAQVALVNSNTTGDVSPTIAADGVTLYFDSYRSGQRHIFFSVASAGNFTTQTVTSGGTTSGAEDYNPYVLPSNAALYFSSARSGSTGSSNLWRAAATGTPGVFGVAQEEATLNAYDKDESPVVTADDLTIYFSTDRLSDGGTSTYGSFDIYVARRTAANLPWNTPVRVNELSTNNNAEHPGSITADGCTLYFMSDRQDIGPQGRFDIFRATRGK